MASAPSSTEPGGEAERVRCLYCGANNFPASAVCWQCGRPLKAAVAGSAPGALPTASPLLTAAPSSAALPLMRPRESTLAPKAAAALGLLFPWIGLPVGMVFLMLDDPRKTHLGWLLIGWSVLGTVLNTIALSSLAAFLTPFLKGLSHPGGGSLPSLPTDGGDGSGVLWPHFLLARLLAF